jgi:hypothetical protein
VLAVVLGLLAFISRRVRVTTAQVTYTAADGTQRTLSKGALVPAGDQPPSDVKEVRQSALTSLWVGKDHRTSTSKTVVFLWTIAIAFGLIALLAADLLGDSKGWDHQIKNGLQEEYLLLLGGPYAAALLAKYATVSQADTAGKPPAPVGEATPRQLIADDQGDTDLGDFQYLLFNLIALAFFLGKFIGHIDLGFPTLPPVLAGLVLTSAGGYSAKKLIQQARPTLTSVVPSTVARGGSIQIYGMSLIVPASTTQTGVAAAPTVSAGGKPATVAAHDHILGADRLTVTVAQDAAIGAGTVSVIRADGVAAVGPAGSDGLPLTVT